MITRILLFGLAATAVITPASAGVNVNFVEPEKYSDLRQLEYRVSDKERAKILDELRAHLEGLGSELQPHQTVTIDVLDIDLAGEREAFVIQREDQRIAGQHTPPSMKLRYVFEEGGQVIASAEETVQDLSYLNHPTLRRDADPLRHEKYMLDQWFRARFIKGETTPQ